MGGMFFKPSVFTKMADTVLGFGRIVSTALDGARKAVIARAHGIEGDGRDVETSDEPLYGAIGIVVRPRDAVDVDVATGLDLSGYAEILGAKIGDHFVPFAGRDLRLHHRVNPKKGEVCLVGYGGGFLSVADATDLKGSQVVLYAPALNSDGSVEAANVIAMDPDQRTISIVQQDGTALVLTPDGIVMRGPEGKSFVDVNAFQWKMSAPSTFFHTGSFQVYTPNDTGTKASTVLVEPGSIQLIHSSGAAIIFNEIGDIIFRTPLGRMMTWSEKGLFIDGNLKVRGIGYFGNPLEWNIPMSTALVGTTYMTSAPSNNLIVSLTPPLPI